MADLKAIGVKWQKKWEDKKIFRVKAEKGKKKYYCLEMYPYPSDKLHMGHLRNYSIGDCFARYKRMNGFCVLYPMGYDAFGLPAENAAIKHRVDPEKWTLDNINSIKEQQKSIGLSYDWDRQIQSCTEDYYKWNQWIFLKFFEKGLAYKRKQFVNWCPGCNTVLANEQVHDGKCWRCSAEAEQKNLDQWFFKIKDYAEELHRDINEKLTEWPQKVRIMQKNWIGKKKGYMQYYKVNKMDLTLSTFTTHHHTSFAEIFIAIAPEHPISIDLVKGTKYEEGAKKFIEKVQKKKMGGSFTPESAKDGYFTGRYAKDFCSGRDLPIYIADFALMEFGTGIVKASAHDQRDFDFAKTHNIELVEVLFPNKLVEKNKSKDKVEFEVVSPGLDEIRMADYSYDGPYDEKVIGTAKVSFDKDVAKVELKINDDVNKRYFEESSVLRQLVYVYFYDKKKAKKMVVEPEGMGSQVQDMEELGFMWSDGKYAVEKGNEKVAECYDGQGYMFRSDKFSGMSVPEAKEKMGAWMVKKKYAKKTITYGLRDWLISRQRYWGTPIPVVYCDKCGIVPVSYKDLPVKLPKDVKFSGSGNPLETSDKFINTKCPKCKKRAKRETDTMDTFVDSSWYFLRYCDPKNKELPFGKEASYWMPVDQYIGGIEHACMHLIYARFFTKALRDMGLIKVDEPFTRLLCQGMVIKDGVKMSKSVGNVVDPGEIMNKYGPDTARLFILFASLPEKELDWNDQGVNGSYKFIQRVFAIYEKEMEFSGDDDLTNKDRFVLSRLNSIIKSVTKHIEGFRLSLAIGAVMEFVNDLSKYQGGEVNQKIWEECLEKVALMLAPFVPHSAEELWEIMGKKGFISLEKWPKHDKKKIDEKVEAAEELVGTTIADIHSVLKLIKKDKAKSIKIIVAHSWKYSLVKCIRNELEKTRDVKDIIGVCMAEDVLKAHSKDVVKLVGMFVKDNSKIPEINVGKDHELESLEENKEVIKEEFDAEVIIEIAEKSQEEKARNALPGKPAILVE